jgi:DNA polymerase III alpha subunit (gram-positive type)
MPSIDLIRNSVPQFHHGLKQTTIDDCLLPMCPAETVLYNPEWPILVGFDLESTGLDVNTVRIADIAFRVNQHQPIQVSRPIATDFSQLVNPGVPMPAEAFDVNKLSDELLSTAPKSKEALLKAIAFLTDIHEATERDVMMVAHNGRRYDGPLLKTELGRNGIELPGWLSIADTQEAYVFLRPLAGPFSLQALISRFIQPHCKNEEVKQQHRAMWDVWMLEYVMNQVPCTNAFYERLVQERVMMKELVVPAFRQWGTKRKAQLVIEAEKEGGGGGDVAKPDERKKKSEPLIDKKPRGLKRNRAPSKKKPTSK